MPARRTLLLNHQRSHPTERKGQGRGASGETAGTTPSLLFCFFHSRRPFRSVPCLLPPPRPRTRAVRMGGDTLVYDSAASSSATQARQRPAPRPQPRRYRDRWSRPRPVPFTPNSTLPGAVLGGARPAAPPALSPEIGKEATSSAFSLCARSLDTHVRKRHTHTRAHTKKGTFVTSHSCRRCALRVEWAWLFQIRSP